MFAADARLRLYFRELLHTYGDRRSNDLVGACCEKHGPRGRLNESCSRGKIGNAQSSLLMQSFDHTTSTATWGQPQKRPKHGTPPSTRKCSTSREPRIGAWRQKVQKSLLDIRGGKSNIIFPVRGWRPLYNLFKNVRGSSRLAFIPSPFHF
jgi:hypothetical protein